ncbi:uncharacterized protein TRIADDRAFT_51590 [Trichoplax adhaerens]|uniref:Photolyase/cryptochrome alpha/beta domain-containing protein n=1 Tax=Trichoplax adhaerens TaxID=10228 RepID=B3RK16_TRIAD|nr:hypothetical protein TRIADDRAFT_51590 [Trichoplax adhaerens]EDV29358.1 hypothetical protein TRIADDRAFT_51590 [Trichoplax adhaerens]|eukprot:XP_002108560.1 hypothetical protein TRIADDRAFT_51590 [Trichoplax adhaerens]
MVCTVVWLRYDLRLIDNPALFHAAKRGHVVIIYILDQETPGKWKLGKASLWWLHHSLKSLQNDLLKFNIPLILRRGADPLTILRQVLLQSRADAVYWNRCYEPYAVKRDQSIEEALKVDDVTVGSFQAGLLYEPWAVKSAKDEPFKLYIMYWNRCLSSDQPRKPYDKPRFNNTLDIKVQTDTLDSWHLVSAKKDWKDELKIVIGCPGEDGAIRKLKEFIKYKLVDYRKGKETVWPSKTSQLSTHLHFGEISPFVVWHTAKESVHLRSVPSDSSQKFLTELGWRDFCFHLLHYYPDFPEKSYKLNFDETIWKVDKEKLKLWQQGKTGYPIVDAGMRELLNTGVISYRVRTIVASFLTKHLLIPWQNGAEWFWDTLVDADLALNSCSWQRITGCGADISSYFYIINPVTQGERFDSDGNYVRKWIPEIAKLSNDYIQQPWEAPAAVLKKAGIALGKTYPKCIVNHKKARDVALTKFAPLKRQEPMDNLKKLPNKKKMKK